MKKILSFIIIAVFATSLNCQNMEKRETENKEFKKITYKEFEREAIKLIGDDWMLVAAGNMDNYNMMTANWGGLGWLWNKPVAFIFVRPQRYTYQFTEKEDFFTLTFFEEKHRDVLKVMGSKSGRDFDKMNYTDLSAFETENGSIAFREATIILECKKLFATTLNESDFIDIELKDRIYPEKDFHTMYVGEITNIWVKE